MADEDNAPDSSGKPQKRGPGRRPKSPVTIDLEATAVPPDAPATEPSPEQNSEPPTPPESASPEAAQPPSSAEPEAAQVPPTAAAPSPAAPPSNVFSIVAAGIIGGLIALLISFGLMTSGVLPAPGHDVADAAAAQAKQASDALTALSARVATLETAAGEAAAGSKDMAAKLDGLVQVTNQLASRLDKVEAAPPPSPGPDLKPAIDELRSRVDRLEAQAAGGSSGDGAVIADLRGRIAAVEASAQALSGRIAALESHPPPGTGASEKAALAIAISALRQAASGSSAFDGDLAMLDVLGVNQADLDALRPLAAKGAPTRAELTGEFPMVVDRIISATTETNPDASFLDRIAAFAGGLVSVRPVGPIAGDTPEAIVSRMRSAVDHGDLEKALAEREALPQSGKDASAAWAQAASDRDAIDRLVGKLAQSIAPAGN